MQGLILPAFFPVITDMGVLEDLFERLTRLDEIERSARNGTLHTFLHELDRGVAALAGDARADALRAIAAALRVDLAFLVQHPEETWTCLHNRLAWHAAARRTIEAWRALREADGRPWLRSLRPPEIGTGGALIEEYRADAPEHFRRVRLDPSGRHVELAYAAGPRRAKDPFVPKPWTCMSWDRITGRRLEDSILELIDEDVAPHERFRIAHEQWGDARLVARANGEVRGRFSIGDSRMVSAVAFTPNGRFVALGGYDDDCGGFVIVHDLKLGRRVMEVRTDDSLFELAISPHAERVAASDGATTFVWNVADQRVLCSLPLRRPQLAFGLDGQTLLTAELGVVRVWDLDREAACLHGYRWGLSNATFSPDGARLITGSCLTDARTGAVVAHLDFESIRYFTGGPPRNAFVLSDDRAVCLERGVEVWNAGTGAKLLTDRERGYSYWHVIALCPDAKRYAITAYFRGLPSRPSLVAVLDVDSGSQLFAFSCDAVSCMAWSPDMRTIAVGLVSGDVQLRDALSGQPLRHLGGNAEPLFDVRFAGSGDCVVAKTESGAERVWHVHSGAPLAAPLPAAIPPWELEQRAGSLALVDRATRATVAWLPASEATVAHPFEPIWAGGPLHVRLEGASSLLSARAS